MPDVDRSDSQRSDTSLKPRVSFNRDVHVKRIVPRENLHHVVVPTNGDGIDYGVTSPVRKERLKKSKKQLAEEAVKVIHQADRIDCVVNDSGHNNERFYSLPTRGKLKSSSKRRNSVEALNDLSPPKKPPRSFTPQSKKDQKSSSFFDLFRKPKVTVRRSVSDAAKSSAVRPQRRRPPGYGSDPEDELKRGHRPKKQLSPIVENSPRDGYFSAENDPANDLDAGVEPVVIDVDNAKQIDSITDSKFSLKETLRSLRRKAQSTPEMLHSSQRPADRPPLTKGRTVDTMVKRLSNDSGSPPPKTNVLITPNVAVQHNNNRPFSYTRGPDEPPPVVYAQVVCANGESGPSKHTVHTTFQSRKQPHSDSDEGLGGEEGTATKRVTHFGDYVEEEAPIRPKLTNYYEKKFDEFVFDSSTRGRGDGKEKRHESFSEEDFEKDFRNDLSARRDLLESRINRRFINGDKPKAPVERYEFHERIVETRRRSESPEYRRNRMEKNRNLYKSTPEIHHQTQYDERLYSYHDSLRREERKGYDPTERKDKFGDSGIENDIRRDSGGGSGDRRRSRRDLDSEEDEGFASSLLIASERQHTEDVAGKKSKDYDSDRPYSREEENYTENLVYKTNNRYDYTPRERSIDDGSHFDPRLDKECEKVRGNDTKKIDKKPPKPEKKRGLDKVRQLFSRDTKKKKEANMVREESLRARYKEYKGSDTCEPIIKKKEITDTNREHHDQRKRLPTPSPSPPATSWFKSLDRLSRKKTKKPPEPPKNPPTKSLRFFGDTDAESGDSTRQKIRTRPVIDRERLRSQSTRDLHNIAEEGDLGRRRNGYRSMTNICEPDSRMGTAGKPPKSPAGSREALRNRDGRARRKRNDMNSSLESSEGDSSQQSQRSVVYLHAATVGDIPDPNRLRNGRRAASREELMSNDSSRIQPQVKTLSRSFSVLAPWRPRHYRDEIDIDYSQQPKVPKTGKYEQNRNGRRDATSTLKKKAQETRRSNQNVSTLSRRSRSKENISRDGNATLYKKKERLPRENSRYNRDDRKISGKSMSVESLGGKKTRDVSRSVSMPKDPERSAGWFRLNKKSKSKSGSTQRL